MNKNDHISKPSGISNRRTSTGGKPIQSRSAKAGAGSRTVLAKEAKRLLACLAQPDAWAFIDPTDESGLILRKKSAAVSVSAGRFSRLHAEALVGHDLARWEKASRVALQITEAGRAYLRRDGTQAGGDAFFEQHRETASIGIATEDGTKRVRIDLDESPLDWLRRRKGRDGQRLIGTAAYAAGERLRADLMQAGLLPSVTARWDAMPTATGPGSPSDATDRMVAARQRVRNAFDAIGGDLSDLLLDLCGFLKGLELIERERHWPPRSAKVVVRLALTRLADHYGIETSARGPAASRGIRAWQAVVIEGGLR